MNQWQPIDLKVFCPVEKCLFFSVCGLNDKKNYLFLISMSARTVPVTLFSCHTIHGGEVVTISVNKQRCQTNDLFRNCNRNLLKIQRVGIWRGVLSRVGE